MPCCLHVRKPPHPFPVMVPPPVPCCAKPLNGEGGGGDTVAFSVTIAHIIYWGAPDAVGEMNARQILSSHWFSGVWAEIHTHPRFCVICGTLDLSLHLSLNLRGSISAPGACRVCAGRASFFYHSPPVPVFAPPHQTIWSTFSPCLRMWPILCTQFMMIARVVVGSGACVCWGPQCAGASEGRVMWL